MPDYPEWGNPNKMTPAYLRIVDESEVNWVHDTGVFCSFEFKGRILKGYVTLRRDSRDADIWVMRSGALPGERRNEALAAMKGR